MLALEGERIYDLEAEVIREIVRADRILRKVIHIMQSRPLMFDPFWAARMESWRENIGAYGGSLVQRQRLLTEDEEEGEICQVITKFRNLISATHR